MRFRLMLVALVGFVSWLFLFSIECYFKNNYVQSYKPLNKPFPNHRADNIFWFLQITDIHLSFVNKFSIAEPLHLFCTNVISTINPSLVLVTGDITHAKFADERSSKQFLVEWQAYHNVLQKCNVDRVPWLDIRGNHDAFDVPSFLDPSNYFINYSMSWKRQSSKSYSYTYRTSFGIYNFIAVDACPSPGPKRPYNFFGVLPASDLFELKKLSAKKGNHTLWLTHYPSATISTDHQMLRQLMSTSIAHVCGHLHTLGGYVSQMYGRHPGGHLELELGDFKDNRRFRLMAFDYDLFSFVDTKMGQWPLVLITNPKDSRFIVPGREPIHRILHSSHVRMLVFSPADIMSVQLEIDGHFLPKPMLVNGGPLYVSMWEAQDYAVGLHEIKVTAVDAVGRQTVCKQSFSLDGTLSGIERLPQLLLLTDLRSLFRFVFLFLWLTLVLSLLLARINYAERSYFYNFIKVRALFCPYFIFLVYFGLGPWYVGEFLTGVYGAVSVHGIYVMGHFIPGAITYLHGILQVVFVHIPILYYSNYMLSSDHKTCQKCVCYSTVVVAVLVQFLWGLSAYPYGYLALVLSPGGTWPLLLIVWLIYKTHSHT